MSGLSFDGPSFRAPVQFTCEGLFSKRIDVGKKKGVKVYGEKMATLRRWIGLSAEKVAYTSKNDGKIKYAYINLKSLKNRELDENEGKKIFNNVEVLSSLGKEILGKEVFKHFITPEEADRITHVGKQVKASSLAKIPEYAYMFKDKKEILGVLSYDYGMYLLIAPEYQKDPDIIVGALKANQELLDPNTDLVLSEDVRTIFESVKKDTNILLRSILDSSYQEGAKVLLYADESVRNNEAFMLNAICKNFDAHQYASKTLKDDRGFQDKVAVILEQTKERKLESITNDRESLSFLDGATEEFTGDQAFMLAVIRKNLQAIGYVSKKLAASNEFQREYAKIVKEKQQSILSSITNEESCLKVFKGASQDIIGDAEFMLSVIRKNPNAYNYIARNLVGDKAFTDEVARISKEKKL